MDKKEQIKEFLNRGVVEVYPDKTSLETVLNSGKKIKVYYGIDPTGPELHLGHLVQLLRLKKLQEWGHHVIILIGDFTAQIGDPTGKDKTRKPLTHQQVLRNARDYKKQIGKVLNLKKTTFKYNSSWLNKLPFSDLYQLSSEFSVADMLERDMFVRRRSEGKPIYLHEFFYPALQAYDALALDVDMQVGGSDQIFNMLAGRTLVKKRKNKEQFVFATKLLEDPTGKKMGKTEGNMVNLTDKPQEMYGKVMSWTDPMIVPALEIATAMSMAAVNQVAKDLAAGTNPKKYKMLLAYKIVEIYHGAKAAAAAEESFKQVFEEKLNPDTIPIFKVKSRSLVDVLAATGLATSKSEARRLIAQGAVKVDTKKVTDENYVFGKSDKDGIVVQKGKRHFAKII